MEVNLVQRNENGKPVTNSLLVAQKFGKEHKHVLESIKSIIHSAENSAQLYISTTYKDNSGKSNPMFIMNRDGFTLLAMGFTGEKALKFKMEFIDAFNQMEDLLNSDDYILMRSQQILQDKVKLLESELHKKEEFISIQSETINELAPDAKYTREVLKCPDTMTTTQIAKELGTSANTLNKILKKLGVQYKVSKQWVLYAKYQDKGYTKTHTYKEEIDGVMKTYHSTVWTEKGKKFIYDILDKNNIHFTKKQLA